MKKKVTFYDNKPKTECENVKNVKIDVREENEKDENEKEYIVKCDMLDRTGINNEPHDEKELKNLKMVKQTDDNKVISSRNLEK